MTVTVSERSFEEAIESALLAGGPDGSAGDAPMVRETPPPWGDTSPGGYRKRRPDEYDPALCLIPRDVVDFVLATQLKGWEKLKRGTACSTLCASSSTRSRRRTRRVGRPAGGP